MPQCSTCLPAKVRTLGPHAVFFTPSLHFPICYVILPRQNSERTKGGSAFHHPSQQIQNEMSTHLEFPPLCSFYATTCRNKKSFIESFQLEQLNKHFAFLFITAYTLISNRFSNTPFSCMRSLRINTLSHSARVSFRVM